MNKIPAGTIAFPFSRFTVRLPEASIPTRAAFFVVDTQPGRFRISRPYNMSDAINTADWLNEAAEDGRIQ